MTFMKPWNLDIYIYIWFFLGATVPVLEPIVPLYYIIKLGNIFSEFVPWKVSNKSHHELMKTYVCKTKVMDPDLPNRRPAILPFQRLEKT